MQILSQQSLSASIELLRKYKAYEMAKFVDWTLIYFREVASDIRTAHEDRDDQLDYPLRGGVLFALPPRTISIVNLYSVENSIEQV